MMYFDLACKRLSESKTKDESAYLARCTLRSDTAGTRFRTVLIAVVQDLLLCAFEIECFRQLCVANRFLINVRKWTNLLRTIFRPRRQFSFEKAKFKVKNLIRFCDYLIDGCSICTQMPADQGIDIILQIRTACIGQRLHLFDIALIELLRVGYAGQNNAVRIVADFLHH